MQFIVETAATDGPTIPLRFCAQAADLLHVSHLQLPGAPIETQMLQESAKVASTWVPLCASGTANENDACWPGQVMLLFSTQASHWVCASDVMPPW